MTIEMIPESDAQPQPATPPPSFADLLPEDAGQMSDSVSGETVFGDVADAEPPPPKKRVQMSKKMQKSMQKFMRQIAEMPALYFNNQAAANPEWALDDEEKEMLTDSVAMVFEILDVGFEIEPLALKFTSIWWIISYPFVVFAYIFLNKKGKIDAKNKEP